MHRGRQMVKANFKSDSYHAARNLEMSSRGTRLVGIARTDFSRTHPVARRHQPLALHLLDHPRCPIVADPQAPLDLIETDA